METQSLEHSRGNALVYRVIFHHQGVAGAINRFPWRCPGRLGIDGSIRQLEGQLKPERGTLTQIRFHLNVPAHEFNQPLDQGQAKPGAPV